MAALKIPAPELAAYCQMQGGESMDFRRWLRLFEKYLEVIEAQQPEGVRLTDSLKNNLLLMRLGAYGQRRIASHPISEQADPTHAEYKQTCSSLFAEPVSPLKARFDFHKRKQEHGEDINDFLSALRELVIDCGYGDRANEMIATQLALGLRSSECQQRLLEEPDIDLERFLKISYAKERSEANTAIIRGETSGQVHLLKTKKQQPFNQKKTSASVKPCGNCGNNSHQTRDGNCPALGKRCSKCGVTGHFAKVCRGGGKAAQNKSTTTKLVRINSIHKTVPPIKTTVFATDSSGVKVPIEFELDSGSPVTIVPTALHQRSFAYLPLQPPDLQLCNCDLSEIKGVQGYFSSTIECGSSSTMAKIYVADSVVPILGRDAFGPLKFCIAQQTAATTAVNSTSTNPEVVSKAASLIETFPNLSSDSLGTFPGFQHKIVLGSDSRPSVTKLRAVPLTRREGAVKEIESMTKSGIWEPVSRSEWVHGLVTVGKPDGGVRITTDLTHLNQFVEPDRYPLPLLKDLFLELRGATIFTKLDLRKAYFHIVLHPDSRYLTATLTHQGLFQYCRLPMGLKDSASVFQRAVAETLQGIDGVLAYLDDILIFGASVQEHDDRLELVLQRLNNNDFRLNLDKCVVGAKSVKFLGQIVENGTIRPDPSKLEPIQNFPVPKTVKQVQSFLGLVNYYSDYLPNSAETVEPLRALTRKDVPFSWSTECEKAFVVLKSSLSQKLLNHIFDPNAPTSVTIDASDHGLGAVLSQQQNGKDVPIMFASHTLRQPETGYATNEREALGIVWALEKWEKFLLGRPFIVYTDHGGLQKLMQVPTSKRQSSKFARWVDRLSAFEYSVQYKPGAQNVAADALSRCPSESDTEILVDHATRPAALVQRVESGGLSIQKIIFETSSDSDLQKIAFFLQNGWPQKSKIPANLRPYYHVRDSLQLEKDGYLTRDGIRILVPQSLCQKLLDLSHKGHPGIVRMKRLIRNSYWWPRMDIIVERFVSQCSGCQASEKSAPTGVRPQNASIPIPNVPWTRLAIDICGPFETAPKHQKFIVAAIDYTSRYPIYLLTTDISALKVTSWLAEMFAIFGNPSVIQSDNGPQFVSKEFSSFCELRDIQHVRIPVYDPRPNGLIERFNKVLKFGVQTFVKDNVSWEEGIRDIVSTYRATPPTPNGKSPANILFKHEMRLPFQVVKRSISKQVEKIEEGEKKCAKEIPKRFKSWYKVGQWVTVKLPYVPKGRSPYSKPLKILEIVGNYTYRLSDNQTWSARRMRPFYPPTVAFPTFVESPVLEQQQHRRHSQRINFGQPPNRFDPSDFA